MQPLLILHRLSSGRWIKLSRGKSVIESSIENIQLSEDWDMDKSESTHKIPKDIQEILESRDQLDRLLKEKFTKQVAVMFADLKGSTEFFETYGDIAGLAMINKYNSLLMPVIEERGRVVEVIGDAIMACFDSPEAAVKTAVKMQKTLQTHNRQTVNKQDEIHIRIGINYGMGIVTER